MPFYPGDGIELGRIDAKKVKDHHARGVAVSEAHYQLAPALGGFQLLGTLGTLLNLDIKLRDGQKQLIGGQMMKLAKLYNIGRV